MNAHAKILKPKQQGAALIVALIMLLILTILGVAVMESSVVEERMAGNFMDRNRAFQGAELALRDAEQWLSTRTAPPIAGEGEVEQIGSVIEGVDSWWLDDQVQNVAWWAANGNPITTDSDTTDDPDSVTAPQGLATLPHFVIEEYNSVCDTVVDPNARDCILVYRITASAWSGRNTTVMLQSLFSKRF